MASEHRRSRILTMATDSIAQPAWPSVKRDGRTIGGITYCMGSAGSFILYCPKCRGPDEHGRFRWQPNDPLETCWTCHGADGTPYGNQSSHVSICMGDDTRRVSTRDFC